ncbi:MAG: oxygenase MpaB family protein, partial [Candidatus Binatia bacterium]
DVTRGYLRSLADFSLFVTPLGRFGAPIAWVLGPMSRFLTLGFLPRPFREELGFEWNDGRQRFFDAAMGAVAAVAVRLPRPVREFPFNVYLWDTRRRIRHGLPIV